MRPIKALNRLYVKNIVCNEILFYPLHVNPNNKIHIFRRHVIFSIYVLGHNNHARSDPSVWLGTSVDVWAIGCVLLYMCTGKQLYPVEYAQQLPLICNNCGRKSGPCLHSIATTRLLNSNRKELQIWNIKNLSDIVSGFLQCRSVDRFQPNYAIEHPFLDEVFEPTITDLLLLPTRVLRLLNMFGERDLEDIDDIMLDIREECEKFGEVMSMKSSQKNNESCNVYVEYKYAEDCSKAQSSLTGRYFDERCVVGTFFPWEHFQENYFY